MKHFSCMLVLLGLALGSIAYGQNPPQAAPPQTPSQASPSQSPSDSGKTTVTGCLTKGSAAGQYTITDAKTGDKTQFAGPEQLDKYLNQTVSLTGTQGQDKAFKPESINQVSASCEKK